MSASQLTRNDEMVTMLSEAISRTDQGLSTVPRQLMVVLRDSCWRERVIRPTGQVVEFDSFEQFVATPPLEGLGSNMKQLRALCGEHPETLDLLDKTVQRKHGGDHKSDSFNESIRNVEAEPRPVGTTAARALRQLRKARPDLHARVVAGEISPHGAAVQAGFRERTISVSLSVPKLARTLLRHLSSDDRHELIRLLVEASV